MGYSVRMIENPKQVLRIFEYCKQHSVPLTAKCEELISIEMKLTLAQIDWHFVTSRVCFKEEAGRRVCLLMKVQASSFNFDLPLPGQTFSFSFQHRTVGHSFHSELLSFIRRTRQAIFSYPPGIYAHRLRESLRIDIDPSDGVLVSLNGESCQTVNLTMDGVAVLVSEKIPLRVGQAVRKLLLIIRGEELEASGRVRHVSKCVEGKYMCGISLCHKDENALQRVREVITEKQLLLAGVHTRPTTSRPRGERLIHAL